MRRIVLTLTAIVLSSGGCGSSGTESGTTTTVGASTTAPSSTTTSTAATTTTAAPATVPTTVPRAVPTVRAPAATQPAPALPVVSYSNCDEVRAAGKAPLLRGQPGYRSGLDRDNDGIACDTEG